MRSSAWKDAEPLVLRQEVAVLRAAESEAARSWHGLSALQEQANATTGSSRLRSGS
jgi:hypothetical protein